MSLTDGDYFNFEYSMLRQVEDFVGFCGCTGTSKTMGSQRR